MVKRAQRYLEVNPWKLEEVNYHEERHLVSESLFSIANEYMGVRGFFDEGYPHKELIGTYYNGIYEKPKNINKSHYKGITEKQHYMVNAANIFYTKIFIGDQTLVFNPKDISNYYRSLEFKSGRMVRSYIYKDLFKLSFTRILDMNRHELSYQIIEIEPINYKGKMTIEFGIDFNTLHWGRKGLWKVKNYSKRKSLGLTTTNQQIYNEFNLKGNVPFGEKYYFENKNNILSVDFKLNDKVRFEKQIVSIIDKKGNLKMDDFKLAAKHLLEIADYYKAYQNNITFYQDFWDKNDIEITGDPLNQQGIRYCLFQLLNTYHGVSETNNIGAKGLTGESYSGHAFWDSETYCFPFYMFTNLKAAKNLLMFRYNTLEQAILRAKELDCVGACYPIATLNGDEGSDLWQHASLQFQPSTSVAYAIWHYVKITKDYDFLINYGFEMLLEISRFLSSRGQYNYDKTKFGYYGVMGPDEFQMMVNHNAYTNLLGMKTMQYFIDTLNKYQDEPHVQKVLKKREFKNDELVTMKDQISKMFIPYDPNTKIYEQHLGFHDLPNINIHDIPITDFPLYSHWSYDRIYRNNLIKQPDVLMFMFLYNQSYDLETKKANYDYYEPKTIHESSLSPSIHSIFASELGYEKEALDFFGFASRLDIDDYNRNTNEGLHMTSIAAAWMNIVYGFGGLRSDGSILKIAPSLPSMWKNFTFRINYAKATLKIKVFNEYILLNASADLDEPICIYDKVYHLKKGEVRINKNVDN